jgi:hypothetical protein
MKVHSRNSVRSVELEDATSLALSVRLARLCYVDPNKEGRPNGTRIHLQARAREPRTMTFEPDDPVLVVETN